jgi:hypothetical protein
LVTFNLTNALVGTEPAAYVLPGSQPVVLPSIPASSTTLEVAGLRVTGPGTFAVATIHQNFQGMGVFTELGDDTQLEAVNIEELLVLSFSEPIQLLGVTFTRVGLDDDFGVYVDGASTPAIEGPIPGGNVLDNAVSTVPFANLFGKVFAFSVSRTNPGTDDYKIAAAFVVPEPSTLLLVSIAAACGLASFAVRSKKTR